MDARDGLHPPAVAVAQPAAIDGLRLGDVGCAVAAKGNAALVLGDAGHGSRPEQFASQTLVGEAVNFLQLPDAGFRRAMRVGDQFQLGLGKIRGDMRMGEGRAERWEMRALGQTSVRIDPQAFLLDAPADAGQFRPGGAQGMQPHPQTLHYAMQRLQFQSLARLKVIPAQIASVAPPSRMLHEQRRDCEFARFPNPRIRIARPTAGGPKHQAAAALQPCSRRKNPHAVRLAACFNDSLSWDQGLPDCGFGKDPGTGVTCAV